MRKVCIILAGIFLSLLFTTCKQFTADIDDYLSYWSTVVSPAGYSIDKPTQTSADGSMCVPSADNLTVTVKLNNPKNVRLIMPDKGNVIHFPGLSTQPVYGTDYTLEQKTSDTLTLEYKSTFLRAHEWSNGDIGPEITFIATDGRIFPSKFSLNLKVDTAPAALEYAEIGKTATADSDGNHFYVLIFRVKDMDSTITDSSIHKDIKKLIVTAGGVPSEIPLSFNAGKTDFETGGDLLAESALHVLDIDHPLPGGNWLLCLKTDVKVGEAEKEYAVSIKDAQGLSSAVIRASTQKNKLPDVQLFNGSTSSALEITAITESAPVSFPGISGKTLTAKALDGALITGTVYKKKADGTWEQLSGSGGTVSGTTPVTINLPALAASGTEALYKISLKAQLSGYDDSDSKDFFVKLLWQEVPVLKIRQRFDPFDGVHSISAETKGYVTEDIIPDAGHYTNENPLVIYNYLDGGYSFELSASAGSTVKYRLGGNPEQSATTSAVISVSHSVVHTLEVWAERDAIAGPHTTLYSKGVQAVSNYTQLKNVAQNAPANGTRIEIVIGDNITASADTEIAVTGGKKLILQSSPSTTVRTVNAGGLGRILKVSGTGSQLELNGIQLTGGNAADGKGGAVCVEAGGVLWLYNKTVITPSTGSDINTPGKNDVYLANGAEITLGSLTTTEPIVARITPQTYSNGNTVLTGNPASVSTNYTKFSVTQPDDGFLWKIKSDGTLKAIPTIINGSDSGAWQKLRELVRIAPAGAVITINGTITATNEGSAGVDANWGEIEITKNLTIKGKTGANSDMLNANRSVLGVDAHRIFNVANGKTLTLQNLTLKNGQGSGSTGNGGAVYTKGGSVEITLCTLIGNEADNGGAVYAEKDGSTAAAVTLKGCTIGGTGPGNANAAAIGSDREGGGIYIGEGCTLTLENSGATGCTVKGNNALRGGGIYVAGTAEIKGTSKILNNTADHVGGGIHSEGTLTLSGDALIKDNSASDHSAVGGGVYVGNGTFTMSDRATVTPSTGENADKPRENDVYLNSTTKIKVDGTLTPQGGIAARITPDSYAITTQVLTAGTGVTLANETYKFAVTPEIVSGTPQPWTVGGNGYLKQGRYTEVPYGKLAAFLANASSTEVTPIELTGAIPAEELHGNSSGPGQLGKTIKAAYKKLELKLPSGLSGVTDMSFCFSDCRYLVSVENIPSGVMNMYNCFRDCAGLTTAPIIPSSVTNMSNCFNGCVSLTTAPTIPSNVTNMSNCFESCRELTTTPVIHANITDMSTCFKGCSKLTTVLPSSIPSTVTSMRGCFEDCSSLTTAPTIPSNVTDMTQCFKGCSKLTTAPSIPSNVTSMWGCFESCSSLITGPEIPSNVTNMTQCFKGCTSLQSVKINRNYSGCNFSSAFQFCTKLNNGGIKVPSDQVGTYQANAGVMKTTANKFSAIP